MSPRTIPEPALTANCFSLIGQKPLIGRDFSPDEDKRNAAPVVILGYSIFKNRYGGDPGIVGRTVRINEVATTVIGVMPDGMKFPDNEDLWLPLVPTGNWGKRDYHGLNVFGRLVDGATLAEAQTEMDQLSKTLAKEYPKSNAGIGVPRPRYPLSRPSLAALAEASRLHRLKYAVRRRPQDFQMASKRKPEVFGCSAGVLHQNAAFAGTHFSSHLSYGLYSRKMRYGHFCSF